MNLFTLQHISLYVSVCNDAVTAQEIGPSLFKFFLHKNNRENFIFNGVRFHLGWNVDILTKLRSLI